MRNIWPLILIQVFLAHAAIASELPTFSGAKFGMTKQQLIELGFKQGSNDRYLSKTTDADVTTSAFLGRVEGSLPAVYNFIIFKSFSLNEKNRCTSFVQDISMIYYVASEGSHKQGEKPKTIIGSGLPEFGGALINENFSIPDKNIEGHYYCKGVKKDGQLVGYEAEFIVTRVDLEDRNTWVSLKEKAMQNPDLSDLLK